MKDIQKLRELLADPRKVLITTHYKPDADALGSSLGLAGVLKARGHRVQVITPSDYPTFLQWMPGDADVRNAEEMTEAELTSQVHNAEVVFCLDFSNLGRIARLGELVANCQAIKVLVDHHLDPQPFADITFWSTAASSTCELIYEVIKGLGLDHLVDKGIAEALYAGIMTDTGSFRHPSTTARVHEIVALLIGHGADVSKVSKLVYDNNTLNRMRFVGFALSERLIVISEYATAYFAISAEDLERFDSKTGDTEGLVNYALSIAGIKFATLIIERPEGVKMSFRSVGDFAANTFASEHWHGGGHKNAAGGRSEYDLEQTVDRFVGLLKAHKDELKKPIKLDTVET